MSNQQTEHSADTGQSGSNGDLWKDALCPECGEPASGTCVIGWKFFCAPCDGRRWGHPQSNYGEGGAAGLLFDARANYLAGA